MDNRYIVYACPDGPLADQLNAYYTEARDRFGPNKAHDYMPHVTLTGFFRDEPSAVPLYLAAIETALKNDALQNGTSPAAPFLKVTGVEINPEFHGLLIAGLRVERLIADFAALVPPGRPEALRLKDWLHLSLAYGFPTPQHEPLAELARRMVNPFAPTRWLLRFYERLAESGWVCHAEWPLDNPPV